MKSFKRFLIESDVTDFNEIESLIKRDCQPFLNQCGGQLVYRGMNSDKPFETKTVRKNRKPMNVAPHLHSLIDSTMNDVHGIRGRSETVFCTGDLDIAKMYGKAYAIFPIEDFKFIWSPIIDDLYLQLRDPMIMLTKRRYVMATTKDWYYPKLFCKMTGFDFKVFKDIVMGLEPTSLLAGEEYAEAAQMLFTEFVKNEYQTTDLAAAIASKMEIMIECERYYAVDLDNLTKHNFMV